MHCGNLVLILHTHLPWVLHHGDWPHGVDWLTEAVAECYIPLLNVFNDLLDDGTPAKVTLDISPVLCEQLEHPDFKEIFIEYCDQKIMAARKDEKNFREWNWDPHHIYLTQYWQNWYETRKQEYLNRYNKSIVGALKELQDKGAIEIMTCGATHGYLPLLGYDRSVNLQIEAAVNNYKKHFGREPRGIWLPECAYRPSYDWKSYIPVAPFHYPHLRPGIEQFLAKFGIKYFVTDQDLLERSNPIGVYITDANDKIIQVGNDEINRYSPKFDQNPLTLYNVSSSEKIEYGTAAIFTRHRDISMQVWSGEVGYPGEPDYLDFHKKHLGSMLRYWRVTDNKADMMYKNLYHPDWTYKKTELQANHFIHHIENSLYYFKDKNGKQGTLCTPFDTELFGHWWFEGPDFLREVIKGISHSPYVNTATASEQLYFMNPKEVISIPEGSWGVNNNHDVWVNPENNWTWEAIYNDELRFSKLTGGIKDSEKDDMLVRILLQALRELMLLQSSDWQFLIYTQSAKDYAEQRFSYHHSDFNKICDFAEEYIQNKAIKPEDLMYLEQAEKRNSIFPELKLEWWTH
jgi:1,4-alpha-glucan branching enzyme